MCHHQINSLQSSDSVYLRQDYFMLILWVLSLAKFYNRKFDIYKDSAPSQVIAAIPVLIALRERVAKLLQEWPDHPVLKQVCCEEFIFITSGLC